MVVCSRCHKNKKESDFSFRNKVKGKRQHYCKVCQNKLSLDHYHENKQRYIKRNKGRRNISRQWFFDLKKTLACSVCKEKHPATLEFHHLDPKKKDEGVSEMVAKGFKKQKILDEIAKCNVLCANCHRKLHWKT